MALIARDIMSFGMIEKSSSLLSSSSSTVLFNVLTNKGKNIQQKQKICKNLMKNSPKAMAISIGIEDLMSPAVNILKKEEDLRLTVKGVISVKQKGKEDLKKKLAKQLDGFMGRNVVFELISTQLDPKTKAPKMSNEAMVILKDESNKSNAVEERIDYKVEFSVDLDFGVPGAITVTNKHQNEFFLENITIHGFDSGLIHFPCNSWIQPIKDYPQKRIFFSNKPYLPSETPDGLKALREKELRNLRGDGTGERKLSDRIYDFDVYNDLGKPDNGIEFNRVILGGENVPYPRRCRTGRPPTNSDVKMESRLEKPGQMYVPRDEQFEQPKRDTFLLGRRNAVFHNLVPIIKSKMLPEHGDINNFAELDRLYKEFSLQDVEITEKLPFLKVFNTIQNSSSGLLLYESPKILSEDKYAWLRDDEFGRQTLAGINPVSIERLTVFPPVSKLDPNIYGPQQSALKEEHIIGHINGMTVQQALDENKLYTLDYHDIYLPFIDRINSLDGRKTYATRTIFFLSPLGTLKPIAIELSLPPGAPSARSKRVITPPVDGTSNWIWLMAKSHVCSNDSSIHQVLNHWLSTHACMEVFILAAHRQLSAMHPIFKLLDPHMRYTLEINSIARQGLISAEGVLELCFTPGRYGMEISAAAYRDIWRFDKKGLPADLIHRGIAVPDPTQPHGLKLLIEDYPYANDGLLIWTQIEKWVQTYVNHYYPNEAAILNDIELQAWYSESINVGHADKRDADWWPTLNTPENLTSILTTIIWLASAQHAALNFGQYPYGGYVPNRPALMRRLIPEENDPEYAKFVSDPEKYFLSAIPSLVQATQLMSIIANLSTHSPDEEYLGERSQLSIWTGDVELGNAFNKFCSEMMKIEKEIEKRNCDPNLRNRCGAGVLPYELLAPSSKPGITCRGVPNSVTI